jgi:hypothetical protein
MATSLLRRGEVEGEAEMGGSVCGGGQEGDNKGSGSGWGFYSAGLGFQVTAPAYVPSDGRSGVMW